MQVLKEEIRVKIEGAAVAVFYECGFEKASMRKIAATAGISTGNLYNYFNNKQELFYAITTPVFEQLNGIIDRLLKQKSDDHFSEEHIEIVANTLAGFVKDYRREFILIMEKSEGTKYATAKNDLINLLESNSVEKFSNKIVQNTILMRLIYTNIVEGIGEILKRNEDGEWTERNVKALIKYHKRSLANFAD